MTDYTKRQSEVILVTADFTSVLDTAEDIASCTVKAYEYGGIGIYLKDFSLKDMTYVSLELASGEGTVFRQSFPTTNYSLVRLALLPDDYTSADIIFDSSVDASSNAKEITEKTASVQIDAGVSGELYRVLFTATTNYGDTYIIEKTISVVSD